MVLLYFYTKMGPWNLLQHKLLHIILNTLRPRQNGRHFPDDIFKWIFLNENVWISLKISSKFVPKVWINNIPALVQIMAWRRPGHKPLSEPMMVQLLAHIYVSPGLNELNKIVRITLNVCNKKTCIFSEKLQNVSLLQNIYEINSSIFWEMSSHKSMA